GLRSRRTFMREMTAGGIGLAGVSWVDALRANAEPLRKSGMGCILLFHNGGPRQYERFGPKPGTQARGARKGSYNPAAGRPVWRGLASDRRSAERHRHHSLDDREGRQSRSRAISHAYGVRTQRGREVSELRFGHRT